MPQLTVKALAEFAQKPIADQMRILAEQKRPSAGAAQFKTHYYNPTRMAVRAFYGRGNNPIVMQSAIARVQAGAGPDHKRDHNVRAIGDFLKHGNLTARILKPVAPQTFAIARNGVDVRLHPDVDAYDGSTRKYILVNYTLVPVDPDLARRTLELMYWLLDELGIRLAITDCELIDLQTGNVFVNSKKLRSTVIKNALQNLRIVNQLWPII